MGIVVVTIGCVGRFGLSWRLRRYVMVVVRVCWSRISGDVFVTVIDDY